MEMPLGITIDRLTVEVSLVDNRPDNILAFGKLYLYEANNQKPFIIVKGFTIRKKQFESVEVIDLSFPAYKAGRGYITSFVLEDKPLWSDVRKLFLSAYYNQTGTKIDVDSTDENEIDLDEVDRGIEQQIKESKQTL